MTINEFKDIETSLDDVDFVIRTVDKWPDLLNRQIERLEWAISEINKLSEPTSCPDEMNLIHSKSRYKNALKQLKAAK